MGVDRIPAPDITDAPPLKQARTPCEIGRGGDWQRTGSQMNVRTAPGGLAIEAGAGAGSEQLRASGTETRPPTRLEKGNSNRGRVCGLDLPLGRSPFER